MIRGYRVSDSLAQLRDFLSEYGATGEPSAGNIAQTELTNALTNIAQASQAVTDMDALVGRSTVTLEPASSAADQSTAGLTAYPDETAGGLSSSKLSAAIGSFLTPSAASGFATVSGGRTTTQINAGSNDSDGAAQSLANTISQGLDNGTYTWTTGAPPATGLGVLSIGTPNTSVGLQPGVSVVLVAASEAAAPTGFGESIGGAGGSGQALIADNEDITFNTGGGTGTVVTGDGNNLIGTPVSGNASEAFDITTGTGNDTIIAATGSNTVSAGTGANMIFTGTATDTIYGNGASDIISGVGGASGQTDTVFQFSGQALIGAFAKNLEFIGGSGASVTIFGGTGSYVINAGTGSDLMAGGSAGSNIIAGGNGAVGSTIFGGGNGDLLIARGSGINEIAAGSGNETLTGSSSTGENFFNTYLGPASASSSALIVGGTGADVYFAGSGSSTIISGGGSDTVAVVNGRGGGSITLSNFQPSNQTIQLQGYAADQAMAAVISQTDVNGSAMVTLADNTAIVFTGTAKIGINAFS